MSHTMVVGTSDPQDFALLSDGVALVGTGFTVEIDWRGNAPGSPDVTVAWLVQAAGTVRVTETQNMAVGTYLYRWKLTDGAGDVGWVPNLSYGADTWKVVAV